MFHFIHRRDLQTVKYAVESAKLPPSFHGARIVLLTDLHGQSFGEDNELLIRRIDGCRPDYVMVAGDMFNWHERDREAPYRLLVHLAKKYPVYYTKVNVIRFHLYMIQRTF